MFEDILDIDSECTKLLINGIIAGEVSFTGNLVVKIYEQINSLVIARNLKPGEEKKLGCDGIIIIGNNSESCYIGFWEAKLPKGKWDYLEKKNTSISHFNKQMNLQSKAEICSWEMFYNNNDNLKNNAFQSIFPNNTLCVWRKDIQRFGVKNGIKQWSNKKLNDFVNNNGKKCKTIKDILEDLFNNNNCLYIINPNGLISVRGIKIFVPSWRDSNLLDKGKGENSLYNFMKKMGVKYAIVMDRKP